MKIMKNQNYNCYSFDLDVGLICFSINVKAEPTIDTGRTGSLTIYQYGMEDISGAGSAGTGETTDAGSARWQ